MAKRGEKMRDSEKFLEALQLLHGLPLDEANLIKFWNLPTLSMDGKRKYLSMLLDNGLQEILFDNPQIQVSFS